MRQERPVGGDDEGGGGIGGAAGAELLEAMQGFVRPVEAGQEDGAQGVDVGEL